MKQFLLPVLVVLGFSSCNPDKDMVDAVVIQTGDVSNDGCGYLLVLQDSAILKPTSLDAAFRHDRMPVKIEYSFSGIKDTCNYGVKVFDMVAISKIKRDI